MDKFQFEEVFFNVCIVINDYILEKEKEDDLRFIDHYMFQATSYVISILHDDLLIKDYSFCKCFIYRSLIEVISIMNMYLAGDITEDAKKLINNYNYITEYNMYKKYKKTLNKRQFDFDQIENNFKDAKQIYRDALNDINSSEFKKLLNSKVPFMGENYSFDSLIRMYCSELYEYYRILSIMIHPNDLILTIDLPKNMKFDALEANLFLPVMNIAEKCYVDVQLPKSKTLKQEFTFIFNNPINHAYLNMATSQKKILYKLSDLIEKQYGINTQSEIFRELGKAIESMTVDKTFGFSEIVKCKYKMVIEMIALNYYIATLPHFIEDRYLMELLTKHTRIKLMEIYGMDTAEKWKDAYNCYLNSGDNVSFDDFKEKFSASLGFIPEETSISKLVYKYIDSMSDSSDETMLAHMKMVYDEAQALSHANGYMITSNSGAFMEYSSVIPFTDMSISCMIDLYYLHNKAYNDTEGEHKANKFIYDVKKCLKEYEKVAQEKNKMDYELKDLKVGYDVKPIDMKKFGVK